MNKGVKFSNSDFVIFINAGDLIINSFYDTKLIKLLNYSLNNNTISCIALACKYNFFDKCIIIKPRKISNRYPRMPTMHQSIIYKRELLLEYKYNINYKICGDFENISILRNNNLKILIYDYQIAQLNAGGVSTQKPLSLIRESIDISTRLYKNNFFVKLFIVTRLFISVFFVFIYYNYKKIQLYN